MEVTIFESPRCLETLFELEGILETVCTSGCSYTIYTALHTIIELESIWEDDNDVADSKKTKVLEDICEYSFLASYCVSRNTKIDTMILKLLGEHKDHRIRWMVLRHPNTPDDILSSLLEDKDKWTWEEMESMNKRTENLTRRVKVKSDREMG